MIIELVDTEMFLAQETGDPVFEEGYQMSVILPKQLAPPEEAYGLLS